MAVSYFVALCALFLGSAAGQPVEASDFQQQCSSLAESLSIPNANLTKSEFVAANTTLNFPNADPSCGRSSQQVSADLCRVTLQVATSSRSQIKMEAWLPKNWTGRFLSTGNGGLGGCIQ
ncbi:hypothetical protein FDECE_18065, partial [Fusarium decemcellulare]